MKACSRCFRELPEEDFHVTVKYGKPYKYPHCRECHRQYMRSHYERNKQAYVDKARVRTSRVLRESRIFLVKYFDENPCIDCGESDIRVLQFDHREPENKVNAVSTMMRQGRSWQAISAEIAKCDVRCANCHIRRTGEQFNWWWSSRTPVA